MLTASTCDGWLLTIDRWGHVAKEGLSPNSLIPILRKLFTAAGLNAAQEYSSHSLRRVNGRPSGSRLQLWKMWAASWTM